MSSLTATFHVQNAVCVNEAKVAVPILTGIGYLDHMIDQWNSHAQVGVGLLTLEKVNGHNTSATVSDQCCIAWMSIVLGDKDIFLTASSATEFW